MRRLAIFVLVLLISLCSRAQNVVTWKFWTKKKAEKTYEIHLTATVDEPWHIYSQSSPKGGPLPTAIVFAKNPLVTAVGKTGEHGEMEIYHDPVFDVDVYSYAGEVDFVQTVRLKAAAKTTITGSVEFMACTKSQCLTPQKLPFTVRLE